MTAMTMMLLLCFGFQCSHCRCSQLDCRCYCYDQCETKGVGRNGPCQDGVETMEWPRTPTRRRDKGLPGSGQQHPVQMKLPSTDALRFVTVVASVASFLFFVGFPVGSFTDPTDATASVRPSSDSAGPSSGSEGVKSPIHRLCHGSSRICLFDNMCSEFVRIQHLSLSMRITLNVPKQDVCFSAGSLEVIFYSRKRQKVVDGEGGDAWRQTTLVTVRNDGGHVHNHGHIHNHGRNSPPQPSP